MLTRGVLAGLMLLLSIPLVQADQTDDHHFMGVSPTGVWETEWGDARYRVYFCGDEGIELCSDLVWINPRDLNERNEKYLDTMVVQYAKRAKPNEWRGKVNAYGTEYDGSLKLVDTNRVVITACMFLILCESFEAFRVEDLDESGV